MHPSSTIPVTVTDDAAAHVAGLGMQAEFERMLEHARQSIAGLQRLDVELVPPYDTGNEDKVTIYATRDLALPRENDPARNQWTCWEIETFSPDVLRHFTLLIVYGSNHGG